MAPLKAGFVRWLVVKRADTASADLVLIDFQPGSKLKGAIAVEDVFQRPVCQVADGLVEEARFYCPVDLPDSRDPGSVANRRSVWDQASLCREMVCNSLEFLSVLCDRERWR